MSQPARAEATGQLGTTPLADVLISLLDRQLTGSLVLEEPGGSKTAFTVSSGCIVKGRTPEPVVRVGELLIARGLLSSDSLKSALASAGQRRTLIGSQLVDSGVVHGDALQAALAEQLARRFLWACRLPDQTVFGFYGGVDFLSSWGGHVLELDPLTLIWRCSREYPQRKRVELVLQRLADRPLSLHPLAEPERFGLNPDETALVESLRAGEHTVRALLSRTPALGDRGGSLVYVLALTRHIDFGDGREPLGTRSARVSDPSPFRAGVRSREVSGPVEGGTRSPVIGEARSGDRRETWPSAPTPSPAPRGNGEPTPSRSSGENAHESRRTPASRGSASGAGGSDGIVSGRPGSLSDGARGSWPPGVHAAVRPSQPPPLRPPSSRPPELVLNELLEREIVQRAARVDQLDHYEALGVGRAATPDQIHAAYLLQVKRWHPDRLPASLGHRRHEVGRVFARVADAHRVLSDPEERARYDAELGSGESEEATVQRVLAAADHFRRAELLTKRNDYAAALRHAEAAFHGDPDSEQHGALYAYLTARSEERLDTRRLSELSALVERAVRRNSDNARWLYYRGCVSQRAGRVEEAMRDFRMVLRLDPNHIDAARELRLYNLRKARTSDRPGLLGQLFGRPSSQPARSQTSRASPSRPPPTKNPRKT